MGAFFLAIEINLCRCHPHVEERNNKGEFIGYGYGFSQSTKFLRVHRKIKLMLQPFQSTNLCPPTLHNTRNGIPFTAKQSLKLSHFPPML
jgi:hypothetical protein